jgi:hypothetical protein
MRAASLIVDLVSLLLAVSVVIRRLAKYSALRIDHVILFALAHAYYFSMSSLMRQLKVFNDTYWFVYRYFVNVTESRQLASSVWSLLFLVAFLTGAHVAEQRRRVAVDDSSLEDGTPPRQPALFEPATLLTALSLAFFMLMAVRFRGVITQGYRSLDPASIQNELGRGVLSATATGTMLCALFGVHVTMRRSDRRHQRLAWAFGAVAIAVPSLTLLLAGGRIYVATSVVAILVWFTQVVRPVKRSFILGAGVCSFVALTALGSIRTGELPDRETLGFFATSESVLTSISQATFLSSEREIFLPARAPQYLASDITNILPRAIVPNKESLRLDPEDDGFSIGSALGAVHLQVSSLINFGYVGSLVVVALSAYGLSRLKLKVQENTASVLSITYATCSAALTFTLFRDPFSISVVRWIIVNGAILPFVYLACATVLKRAPLMERHTSLTAPSTNV